MANELTHIKDDVLDGQLVVDLAKQQVTTRVGGVVTGLTLDSYVKNDMDSTFMPMAMLPITRVGDTNYVPMDIKGDFRSSTYPTYARSYSLIETDGSITLLRAGYNGSFRGLFYTYSPSGRLNPTDAVVTDFQYAPGWLGANEYVESVRSGTTTGFLAIIRSKSDRSIFKAQWIEHNGTLNAQFHTYIDISDIVSPLAGNIYSAVYSPDLNLFIGVDYTQSVFLTQKLSIYPNTRTFSASPISGSQPAMSAKQLTWSSITGESGTGTQAITIQFDDLADYNSKIKRIDGVPAVQPSTNIMWWLGGNPNINIAYLNGTLRVQMYVQTYFYGTGGNAPVVQALSLCYEYTNSNATIKPISYADGPEYQSLPWYFDLNNTQAVDTSAVPGTVTPAYKRNKFPIVSSVYQHDIPSMFYTGNRAIAIMNNGDTAGTDIYEMAMTGTGSTPQEILYNTIIRPPHRDRKPIVWQYYSTTSDASLMAKALQYARFLGPRQVMFTATSKMAGETYASNKKCVGMLPDMLVSETYYIEERNASVGGLKPLTNITKTNNQGVGIAALSKVIVGDNPAFIIRSSAIGAGDNFTNYAVDYGYNAVTGDITQTYTCSSNAKVFFDSVMNQIIYTSGLQEPTKRTWVAHPIGNLTGTKMVFCVAVSFSVTNTYVRTVIALVTATVASSTFAFDSSVPVVQKTVFASGTDYPDYSAMLWTTGVAAFQHTTGNGKWYITGNHGGAEAPGNNQTWSWVLEFDPSNNTIPRSASPQAYPTPSWWTIVSDIHEFFGLYQSACWYDSYTKAVMSYVDRTYVNAQGGRIFQTFDVILSQSTVPWTEVMLTTTVSGSGFFLYVSEFPVFIRGQYLKVASQTLSLASWDPSPANKTFLVYVRENNGVLTVVGYTTPQQESLSLVYIGSVTTNDKLVTSSNFDKVTRLDTYRTSDKGALKGSAIPVLPGLYSPTWNVSGYTVRENTTLTLQANDIVNVHNGQARITNLGSITNAVVNNNQTSLDITPTAAADNSIYIPYNYVDDGGNAGQGSISMIIAPLQPVAALIYTTSNEASNAQATHRPGDRTYAWPTDEYHIYDRQTNSVYYYNNSTSSWFPASGAKIPDLLRYPREVFNPETQLRYYVHSDHVTGPGRPLSQREMSNLVLQAYPDDTSISRTNTVFANNQNAWYLMGPSYNAQTYGETPRASWRFIHELNLSRSTTITIRSMCDDTFVMGLINGSVLHRNNNYSTLLSTQVTLPAGLNRLVAQHTNTGGFTYMIFDVRDENGNILTSSHPTEWTLMSPDNGEGSYYG